MYIERQLEKKFTAISEEYACVLLTGPRQVGKSTMLRHLMEGTARAEVSLDDLEERRLAKTDPAMFLKLHPAPVLIDEVQYAPELFTYIKIAVDNGAAPGSYWLTGSQAYRLMELAQESLAGRTAILHMSALSQAELCGAKDVSPFSLELDDLQKRKTLLCPPRSKSTKEFGMVRFPGTEAANIKTGMFFTVVIFRPILTAMYPPRFPAWIR